MRWLEELGGGVDGLRWSLGVSIMVIPREHQERIEEFQPGAPVRSSPHHFDFLVRRFHGAVADIRIEETIFDGGIVLLKARREGGQGLPRIVQIRGDKPIKVGHLPGDQHGVERDQTREEGWHVGDGLQELVPRGEFFWPLWGLRLGVIDNL